MANARTTRATPAQIARVSAGKAEVEYKSVMTVLLTF